jgi:hypothetical protein
VAIFVLVHGAWGGAHGFRKVRGPLRALEHYPIPSCADPKGYWHAVLQQIEGAASSAGTAQGQGQGALTIAQGVIKQMPELERKLATELQVTIPDLTRSK